MKPKSTPAPTPSPYAAFVGIDRSDAKIDTTVFDPRGEDLGHREISSDPAALQEWILALRRRIPHGTLALCIEQPCANLAAFFSRLDFVDLLLVNPATYRRWHDAFRPSKAGNDESDSAGLAAMARENHARIHVWKPDDPQTRRLRSLVEARRSLVDLRTRLNNQLVALLKNYHPQALEITGKYLHGRVACDLLRKWPTLQDIRKARPATLRKFYHARRSRRPDTIDRRIRIVAEAVPLTDDPAILESSALHAKAIVAQFDALRPAIAAFDTQIAELLDAHEDAAIFKSLPGAGSNLAARLLTAFGTDRQKFPSARAIQDFSGISPVLRQSGKKRMVLRRHACPAFIRQSFLEWVGQTLTKSQWARAYYEQQKARGVKTYTARRALAYKWIRIIWRCWQDRTPYDETVYIEALTRRNSPLVPAIRELQNISTKL